MISTIDFAASGDILGFGVWLPAVEASAPVSRIPSSGDELSFEGNAIKLSEGKMLTD